MASESNGLDIGANGSAKPVMQILVQSDGVAVQVSHNVPADVAEGLLYRALQHMSRTILRAQLKQDAAEPKIEVFPSAHGFHPRGLA